MLVILLAHAAAALIGAPLVRAVGRNAFYILGAIPAVSAVWIALQSPLALAAAPREETFAWIPAFGMELAFRLDPLSWVLALVATAIGAVVMAYCARYFKDTEPGLGRFAAVLTAFAGAMVGLVLADDVMLLYIFWELTTIFSYLLIGHYAEKQSSRRAAMNALISTTAGGLAMFVGLLMLAADAGTLRISGILASGIWASPDAFLLTAALLVVAGAATKSALVPTHFWLPGAMAAPTPVSAYLHAAAMVKAGVYLVLRMAPGFHELPVVQIVLCVLGAATMLLGGWRALRQTDIKLLLAYGTVSQLGFLMAVAGLATHDAILAATAMLLAHAIFKAPLFMVVGIIDKKFGTRDLRILSGVGRIAPVVAAIGILSAASMAAVPPLFGFLAKESIYTALWYGGTAHRVLLMSLVAGSILTVAYSWRFVTGAFGTARGAARSPHAVIPAGFWLPPAVVTLGTIGLVVLAGPTEEVARAVAAVVPGADNGVHLAVIPHLGVPLLLSAITLGCGALLVLAARPFERLQKTLSPQSWAGGRIDEHIDAERGFRRIMRGIDATAVAITPLYQRGSLPFTLGTAFVVLTVLAVPILLTEELPRNLIVHEEPVEWLLLLVATVAAIGTARARRRLRAVLLVTATGYVAALYFMLWGAPDVATTQVLVEAIMTVLLVLVLRRLPIHFSRRPLQLDRWVRWIVAIGAAAAMCGVAVYAAAARTAQPLGPGLIEPAYTIGGGHNVVNVVLVDARAWDTMGEISVLLVVASGIASLIFVTRRETQLARAREIAPHTSIWRRPVRENLPRNVLDFDVAAPEAEETGNRWRTWLPAGRTLAPERRMVVLEVIARIAFPLIMMLSIYLLMAGHNLPGGGFAGGLVAGLGITLRYLAGGRYELSEAAPIQPGAVLGTGMAIAVLAAVAPLLVGGGIFSQYIPVFEVPLLGEVHLPSALVFDIGVYLVVVGLILDILRSLGAQIDQHQEAEFDVS